MDEQEKEKYKEHLDDLKENDSDLYEELENPGDYLYGRNPEKDEKKDVTGIFIKAGVLLIALFMVLTTAGTLLRYFNLPSIEFLQKSEQLSRNEQIQQYKEAVVTIEAGGSKGTGFNVSEDGLVITNHHVVDNMKKVGVYFPNGFSQEATVVKTLPELDIAFLQIDAGNDLPFIEVSENKAWEEGEPITFIGNPLMHHQIANDGVIIGAMESSNLAKEVMMLDAPVYKGNSGSPVINDEGKVVSVIYATTMRDVDGERKNVGLAVPAEHFIDILHRRK
ncbi:trypsin-like peptidase domain-containing protein [Bacillus marinisedimentorum]|uniref:trypsin-like peptidase domain-containing protein n=1 Tax=Bacillus marinisedimentorum TaxID=1821260 RepID=UPI0008726B1D|nr:trypsin-like peptidase domain-containing protein [Bacillus marinisedimentorum]